ncbi:hypothetical protein [Alistipes putredinis]|jgi:hypothetical protein|uniref:hypothetical protein n=1 Tax=Alistipes putredinis TaxID=28117 RepID=UPI00241C1401|nr:hypothetical protein [Alistipes putredinis]
MAQDTYIDEMTIYNPSGKAIYDAPVTTSAIIKYALMGDYYIELPFSLLTPLDFPLGSYITYKGRKFEIMSEVYPDFDNKTGGYKYTLQFQAQQNHMKNFICFWLGGDNPEAVFHNTTDLASFGALIVANMNKALGGNNWQMGSVNVEHPETNKLVSFNGDTCWDALSSIAETFDVEWWTEENGSIVTLHFGKLNFGTPETFKRGEVVKSIPAKKGDDSEYGTRFYVFGSTRNLTKEYGQSEQGGVTNHVSEVRLRLPDGQQYIDARPGLTKNEIKEVVVFFDDIYPKNTETVTSVETIDRTIIEGQTDKAYVMVCNDTPFLPSDVIEGETLGAHFTSGDLIGWDFELALIDDNGDNIDPATWKPEDGFNKKFEIIAQVETSGESQQIIPNENMRPRGKDDDRGPDTFVLTGVKLPQQRIDEAEQELLNAGTSYAAKHSSDTTVYDCETNPVYCTHNEKNYEAGQAVRLMGPQFGIDGRLSRIQGYEKKLYNEYIATYTVGDNTPYSRLGSIESDVKASLYSQRIGIAENGAAIYLITRYDNTFPTDTNAYSARRAIWEFANKQAPDTFKGRMTFNAGAQFGPSYASGITGVGGFINEKGAGELESLFIRRFLEVPELRYNRVGISVGDDWSAPGAGVIESVDKDQKLVTLKLEEGEIGAVAVGDICMGIFHDFDPSNNATADSDDGRGNFSFAGFATVYFRITEVLGDRNEQFRYELRPLSATFTKQIDPMESMTFVAYGSFTNTARQSSRYSTRTYQRYLRNVSDWEFTAENIAAQFGDLTNLSVFGIQMSGYSAYLDNIYLQGMISSLDKKALLDTRSKLFRLVGDNGVGVAFTPEAGWKQGKLYDPATGQFQKEFDIEQIDQTATEAQATANSADRKAQQAKDYIDNTLPGELSEINKRLDGVVENWFYPYTPSLYNEPAQTWIADGEQENHIGDTFTNTLPANFDPTDAGCWEQGSIGASYIDGIKTWDQIKIADSTRIRLKTPVGGIPKGAVLSVGEGYTMGYNPIASSGAVIASYVWSQSYTVGSDNPYIAFVIRKTDNAKITPAEYPQIHFTISSDETTNPDAGKSWRWVKEEDGTYKWTPIADSDAVKALQEAARAQDTADAKRRVFVVTPTTPYDVGDIWTQGEGGDIMRCIESRATGNFESSDWDKASKYTDDTAANEAKDEIANLQFGARNYIARQFLYAWNSAKEGVSDVVTSGSDADGAYMKIDANKASNAGVAIAATSQIVNWTDCFGGKITYKAGMSYVFKARIKLPETKTGCVFCAVYEDGYDIISRPPSAPYSDVYEAVYTTKSGKSLLKIVLYVDYWRPIYIYDIQLTEGNKAPTGYITAEEDVQAQIEQVKLDVDYIASDSSLTPSDKQQVANEWVRIQSEYWSIMANAEKYDVPTDSFTVYFQALEDYLTPLLADMSTTSEITGTEFRKVFSDYYEISSNMSDLIDDAIDESIKSTEYLKKAMEDGSTEVKGGLIMTNVMLLKNAEGDVTAGVSGLQEDDVPFWSGADYTNRKKAVFRVHADGEVHATKGTVGILQVKNDSVEVSDAAASGDKIILTPYRITSISQVLGAVSVPGVIETKEVSALATGQSNPFVRNVYKSSPPFTCGQGVQMSARITARITGNAEGGGGGVKIEVVNALTGKADPLYRNSTAEAQNTNLNIDETISYLFTGAAQKYYIRITVEASAAGKLTASATMNAAQFNFVKDIRKNLIAPNGVAVVKGSSNYAVFTGDIFEVLIGKAGLRIQNGYVYKKDTDHKTWTKI